MHANSVSKYFYMQNSVKNDKNTCICSFVIENVMELGLGENDVNPVCGKASGALSGAQHFVWPNASLR